ELIRDFRWPGAEHDDLADDDDDLYGYADDDIEDLAEGRERRPRPARPARAARTGRVARPTRASRSPMDNYPVEEPEDDPGEEFEHDTQHTLFDTPVTRADTDEFPPVPEDAVAASGEQMRRAIVARSGIAAGAVPATTPKSELVDEPAPAPRQPETTSDYRLPSTDLLIDG